MASVFSLHLPHFRLPHRSTATALRSNTGVLHCRCRSSEPEIASNRSVSVGERVISKREALGRILFSLLSLPLLDAKDALAEPELDLEFQTYEDEKEKFSILYPKGWLSGVGDASGFKSVTAFLPKEESDSNVTVAITGIGPDFTRIESFGKVDEFAENLVTGLDRSWNNPPGLAAKLINSKSANGFYYIEYTLQNPGERRRHIFSAIGMANNGWYNRLYTVTGQFMQDESEKFSSQIEKMVSSFRFI